MVSLEQVKLLESKVTRMIDFVAKVTEENTKLKEKLDSYEKRTGELEILFQRFKDDQGRIEDGILSALDLLNKFEDAVGGKLSGGVKLQEPVALEKQTALEKPTIPTKPTTEIPEEEPIRDEEPIPDKEPIPDEDDDQAVSGAELDIF